MDSLIKQGEKSPFDPDEKWVQFDENYGYKLGELLGKGTFGCVMQATNKATGEKVAVKLIEEPFSSRY